MLLKSIQSTAAFLFGKVYSQLGICTLQWVIRIPSLYIIHVMSKLWSGHPPPAMVNTKICTVGTEQSGCTAA
jgi:hypothetical protein